MEVKHPTQLAEEAQAEYSRGNYLSAANLFKAAADGFLVSAESATAAEMNNNCSAAYLKGGDAESALAAVIGTEQVFSACGDIKHQAMAIGNQAAALEKLHRNDEALASYQKSAQLLTEAGEYELRAVVYQSISTMHLRKGRFLEAYAAMRIGVMGIKHPRASQKVLKILLEVPFKLIK